MAQNFSDPLAAYVYGQTGIPGAFTTGLENLGFLGAPFGGVEKNYQAQIQFQQLLKSVLDQQIGAFNNNNNINALPFNMRSIFQEASPYLNDPWYGIMGAPAMFQNGYQQGALPNNPSAAYRVWKEQASGYPDFPPPSALYNFTGQQSAFGPNGALSGTQTGNPNYPTTQSLSNPSNQLVGHYTVPLIGGGSMTVNASSPQAAQDNVRAQGGNPDTSATTSGQAPRAPSMTG